MSRAIWKGHISFGLVQVPVALHPATQDEDLDMSLLDRRDFGPIGYRKVNKATGEEVPPSEIVRGYEHAEGGWVILTDEELRAANPKASQTIEIVAFVDANAIDPRYYVRPYYVAPVKKNTKAYALLREILRRAGKIGIAKVVLRTRQYMAALLVRDDILVLELLRYASELRGVDEFDLPGADLAAIGVTDRELKMADLLVEALATEWEPAAWKDEYRADLLRLIEEKARTGRISPIPVAGAGAEEPVDIMALLKRSLEATKVEA